jgi:UDP-glucose-4-epimerase GalE
VKVLVAGGAGYIGSHTCKALAEAGHTPIVYDNLHTGHAWAVKWGPLERGDLNDAGTLDVVLKRHRPQAVIDFAGLIDVGESNREPALYYRNNVTSVVTLVEAMRANDVGSIVFSSSCATYGLPERLPMVEDMRQEPINPYGRTKLMSEMILRDACAAYGMAAVALRYFNASGADASGESGEEHDPETHLIPLVLQAAAGTRANITVFGNDYDTPDRTCIRDYVHVSDLASAHVAALDVCAPGKFAAYNLGTGRGVSITEVIELARRITGRPIAVSTAARRAGDPPMLFADASLANRELQWTPVHSDPANIVQTAWAWMTEHRKRVIGAG